MSEVDGKEYLLNNMVSRTRDLSDLAKALARYIEIVEFDNSQGADTILLRFERALVERFGSSRIEIRTREDGHNTPHFHFVGPDIDASFTIEECELLAGEVDRRTLRKIRRFYFENGGRERLIHFWAATRNS